MVVVVVVVVEVVEVVVVVVVEVVVVVVEVVVVDAGRSLSVHLSRRNLSRSYSPKRMSMLVIRSPCKQKI